MSSSDKSAESITPEFNAAANRTEKETVAEERHEKKKETFQKSEMAKQEQLDADQKKKEKETEFRENSADITRSEGRASGSEQVKKEELSMAGGQRPPFEMGAQKVVNNTHRENMSQDAKNAKTREGAYKKTHDRFEKSGSNHELQQGRDKDNDFER